MENNDADQAEVQVRWEIFDGHVVKITRSVQR